MKFGGIIALLSSFTASLIRTYLFTQFSCCLVMEDLKRGQVLKPNYNLHSATETCQLFSAPYSTLVLILGKKNRIPSPTLIGYVLLGAGVWV